MAIVNILSCIMRKPDFCLCENKGTDHLRSNCEADQRLCFRYTDSTISLLFMPPTSKKLRGHIGLGLSVQSSPVQSSLSVMRE